MAQTYIEKKYPSLDNTVYVFKRGGKPPLLNSTF